MKVTLENYGLKVINTDTENKIISGVVFQIKDENGESIDVEIYSLPYESLAKLLFKEPPGLVIGKLKTIDGTTMFGILAEPYLVKDKKEITSFKGWRNYIKSRNL